MYTYKLSQLNELFFLFQCRKNIQLVTEKPESGKLFKFNFFFVISDCYKIEILALLPKILNKCLFREIFTVSTIIHI